MSKRRDTLLGLTDAEMEMVLAAAATLPLEKRSCFLERVIALRAINPDEGAEAALARAMTGLIQHSAA